MSNQNTAKNIAAVADTTDGAKQQRPFRVTFVAANNGLQTEQRVHGRRAFPDRTGHQPKLGETWLVNVAGENPKGTVHFVKCLELITTGAAASQVARTLSKVKPGTVIEIGDPVDMTAVSRWPQETAVSKPNINLVRAPGNDVIERIKAWATPVKVVGLSDLKFAYARQRIETNDVAASMLSQLGSTMATTVMLQGIVDDCAGQLKQASETDHAIGLALFTARKVMTQLKEDKANLAKETLSYARLVKKLNLKHEDELAAQVTAAKEALDKKRTEHNEAMSIGKEKLSEAETGMYFCYSDDCVKAVMELLEKKVVHEGMVADYRNQLVAGLDAFEQHLASLT